MEYAISNRKNFQEVAKSLGGIKFKWVKNQYPKISRFIFHQRGTSWKFSQ